MKSRSSSRLQDRDWGGVATGVADWVNPLLSSPGSPLEAVAMAGSFEPSLMPRTSVQQGIMTGLAGLTARSTSALLEMGTRRLVPRGAGLPAKLAARAILGGVGAGIAKIKYEPGESMWRSGLRSGGYLMAWSAAGGAVYDVSTSATGAAKGRGALRAGITSAAVMGGLLAWSARNLKERKSVIKRWPVEQKNELPMAVGIGYAVYAAGAGLGKGYLVSRRGIVAYLGPGIPKQVLGRAINAGLWAGGAVVFYNTIVRFVGRSNEKVEPAYATPPASPYLSGSPESKSPFVELGLQGRRYVTDVVTPALIEEVTGEPAIAPPIRVFIGFNSEPMYSMGRTEMAMAELERTGALDRGHLLLVSPTGTGWVDQTMIESTELLTRGDVATCVVQYAKSPSFLAAQQVPLGRHQFRALLWSVKQRLAERAPGDRPKVYVFGESLGAWSSSDTLMYQGIEGFDHYGIDRALWVGLPGLARWSRNGMAHGGSDLVPEGTVGVFDRHEELAALSDEERAALRAIILSHDNDPIANMSPDTLVRKPEWLGEQRGRGVPEDMDWVPAITGMQVMIDAMNAMVTVPGEFGSFGHDYRADMARFVKDAFGLNDTTEEQVTAIEEMLVRLDLDRSERIKAAKAEDAPLPPQYKDYAEAGDLPTSVAGVPLVEKRTPGAHWLKAIFGERGTKNLSETAKLQ
jgi:uncharacterized membrane protein